jgi:protein-S-isoprenylcysteine O-methyltransferase Ste14
MKVSYLLRQLLSVLILPVTVTILVPLWIVRAYGVPMAAPRGIGAWLLALAGAPTLVVGLVLAWASVARFGRDGRGTLAPWDPPRALVVRGPYAFVRNPMISGVLLVLTGEALALRSWPHGAWAGAFAALNAVYIPLVEEPGLRARFGDAYQLYCEHVPRLVPRPRPWRGGRPPGRGTGPSPRAHIPFSSGDEP